MSTPVTLIRLSQADALSLHDLDENFARLAAAVNALADKQLVQIGAAGGDLEYLPVTGGPLLGQLSAPSILVGPDEKHPVITANDTATTADTGVVRKAAGAPDSAQEQPGTYSQQATQSILDELRALKVALRGAGSLD